LLSFILFIIILFSTTSNFNKSPTFKSKYALIFGGINTCCSEGLDLGAIIGLTFSSISHLYIDSISPHISRSQSYCAASCLFNNRLSELSHNNLRLAALLSFSFFLRFYHGCFLFWFNFHLRNLWNQLTSVKSTSKCPIVRCIDGVFGYIIGLT